MDRSPAKSEPGSTPREQKWDYEAVILLCASRLRAIIGHCGIIMTIVLESSWFLQNVFGSLWFGSLWFGLIFCQNSYFFHSILITWELIWHTPKWNKFKQMELLHIVSQQYPYINQKNCPISILKFSIKNDFLTQTLAQPKNHIKIHIKIFNNQKLNATSQTPIQYTTFHQYTSFTKYLYLLRYRDIYTSTPHFFTQTVSKFDLFDLRNPKI